MLRSHISNSRGLAKGLQIGAFLLCLNAILMISFWKRDASRRQAVFQGPAGETVVDTRSIERASIWNPASGTYTHLHRDMDHRKHLLILLTAADCASCLLSLGEWVDLAKQHPQDFEVDMLYFGTSEGELKQFEREHRLPFRSFLDKNGELAKFVSLPQSTPASILVDQDMRVLAAEDGGADAELHRKYVAKVSRFL